MDRQGQGLRETPAYWAFRHFSGFVNPDGRLVVALQNAGELPRTLTLGARGNALELELPARSWVTITH